MSSRFGGEPARPQTTSKACPTASNSKDPLESVLIGMDSRWHCSRHCPTIRGSWEERGGSEPVQRPAGVCCLLPCPASGDSGLTNTGVWVIIPSANLQYLVTDGADVTDGPSTWPGKARKGNERNRGEKGAGGCQLNSRRPAFHGLF